MKSAGAKPDSALLSSRLRRHCLACVPALVLGGLLPSMASASARDDFFHAVRFDDVRGLRSLLAQGVDPNLAEPSRGESGLIVALREKSMKVFAVLLDTQDIDVNAQARNGDTALMIASYLGNEPAAEALLARGAQVNRPGWTALHYAAASGSDGIVQLLLKNSAYINAESPNKTTPIMMAAYMGHIQTVKLLLDAGADATLKNELGLTAIDIAQKSGHRDIAEGLTYRLRKEGKL
ncbi:ankyrin repeat domain-containing protein [Noviherbaspirillum massiliense]|uniref:ankyrin repeat domain-containing protein n=1 Tax=Noviherbaspirillum massiliense TaxID=1465823 RepID=UPI0003007EBE|nr:ankyrin repeat domain-containing protein [Noviherbaspirillum massiliense]